MRQGTPQFEPRFTSRGPAKEPLAETPNPTVFVVDDDEGIRESLRLLIDEVGLQAEMFGHAQEFLLEYDPSRPGCLVLDLRMPGMSGLELLRKLCERAVEIPTIIITGHADVPTTVAVMQAGALDLIEKPFRNQVLLERIQEAVDLDVRARRRRRERREVQSRLQLLTPREQEVLDRLMAGKTNKHTAYDLGISPKTVDFHRANILEKAGVSSLIELVHMVELGAAV